MTLGYTYHSRKPLVQATISYVEMHIKLGVSSKKGHLPPRMLSFVCFVAWC